MYNIGSLKYIVPWSSFKSIKFVCLCRFHNPAEEPELNQDIIPYLDDNVQLSIEEYRDKLYEVKAFSTVFCTYICWLYFFSYHSQSIVAKREELLEARAQVGGSDGGKVAGGSVEPPQDSGDCLVQSISEMDLVDHEPSPTSGKPSSHPQPPQKVTCMIHTWTHRYW